MAIQACTLFSTECARMTLGFIPSMLPLGGAEVTHGRRWGSTTDMEGLQTPPRNYSAMSIHENITKSVRERSRPVNTSESDSIL